MFHDWGIIPIRNARRYFYNTLLPSRRRRPSPPWPSGLKRWNQTLVPVVRARFEPRCGAATLCPYA